ncbi:lipopolysaccharide-induced tumor necrosis factor-alpha factor homolog [Drosophila kikkawai]|uniref:Lipopolysaccharide-induced tumor necrosis factor-alpha factor homolog n=1 Tax=Drosophila kikkawai TaxID=30033 RepID=A0A6P4I8P7_DROKI|nr:lipopolysaccharide-induced tumor necrosis factor-alpha factor homolog [Drosophila kikkawai]
MSYNQLSSESGDSPPPYSDEPDTDPQPEIRLDTASPHGVYPQVPVPAQLSPTLPVTVVHQTSVVVDTPGGGMICPYCNARIRVRVERHATGKTYCLALMLCLFLCWPCVCAPCCCNCCYKTSQFCPNCNACLGSF